MVRSAVEAVTKRTDVSAGWRAAETCVSEVKSETLEFIQRSLEKRYAVV
jgi:hypothetical protein